MDEDKQHVWVGPTEVGEDPGQGQLSSSPGSQASTCFQTRDKAFGSSCKISCISSEASNSGSTSTAECYYFLQRRAQCVRVAVRLDSLMQENQLCSL